LIMRFGHSSELRPIVKNSQAHLRTDGTSEGKPSVAVVTNPLATFLSHLQTNRSG
jgi:hypothetical protein